MTSTLSVQEKMMALERVWQPGQGLIGWLSTINHKNIGKRYIVTGFMFFLLAGIAAVLMRIQLMYPENTFLNVDQYNQLFTTHGATMMFLFAVPIMQGVGIYLVPLMVGARDVAFPKMNALGYYTYLLSGIVLWISLFLGTGPDGGWFAYVPLTISRYSPTYGMDVVFIGLMVAHLVLLPYKWQVNAYMSIYWTLIGAHLLLAGFLVLENTYVLVLGWLGYYNSERHWGVEVDGFSSYFTVAVWVVIYATVFLSPYLI